MISRMCNGVYVKAPQFVTIAIEGDAGDVARRRLTRTSKRICGNWPTVPPHILARHALMGDRDLEECGRARIDVVDYKNRILNSASRFQSTGNPWEETTASATCVFEEPKTNCERRRREVRSKYKNESDQIECLRHFCQHSFAWQNRV